ncbi:hypothetical protein [Mesoterricola silvestris]|uniref:hypothetical protein n=1 Tax=Mesoterricola silvestris TaxID=2927979 RepID=UPI00292E087A|nr:hypothetical protein [Mesoterricola silvestris]
MPMFRSAVFGRIALAYGMGIALPISLSAQPARPVAATSNIESFVQNFYNWYAPMAIRGGGDQSAWEVAIKKKGSLFTPQLLKALKADSDAQAKTPGEIVGIDFDPFLSSQDPVKRYVVGKVVQDGDKYLIEIFGVQPGKMKERPDVIAEVTALEGKFQFSNFNYQKNRDLLDVLKKLAADRARPQK